MIIITKASSRMSHHPIGKVKRRKGCVFRGPAASARRSAHNGPRFMPLAGRPHDIQALFSAGMDVTILRFSPFDGGESAVEWPNNR